MSEAPLASKGFFGLLVKSPDSPDMPAAVRHVHPCECAALNAFDPCTDFGTNVRLTFAAIGQIASPLRKLLG